MNKQKAYTVSQLSKMAKVSIRTLHYYDQIGLLTPNRQENGFREYHDEHLVRLQQILVYRELDFSIDKIKEILSADGYDILVSLDEQKSMLQQRIEQAQSMLESLDVTKSKVRGKLNRDLLFVSLPKEKLEHWDKLEQEKYGADLIEKKFQLIGSLSENETKYYSDQNEKFYKEYCLLLDSPVSDERVQESVLQLYKLMNTFLYKIHEHYGEGLAKHLSEAMMFFADNILKGQLDELRTFGAVQ